MTKKIFAMFLAVLMVVSMLPTSVFAANCPGEGSPKHTTSNCDYTVVKVTDPTCGTAGHTSYKCNECGYVFAEKTAEPTGEHVLVPTEGTAPTCSKDGYEPGVKCSVEGCTYSKKGAKIPALGKEGTNACEWKLVSGFDCDTKGGKLVYKCAFCGDTRESETGNKAHDHVIMWNYYVAISDTQAAFLCAHAQTHGCSYYEVADIKNAHTCDEYDYIVAKVEADCDSDGMESYRQCRVCNNKFALERDEETDELVPLTAKDIEEDYFIKAHHTFVDKDGNDYEPTCEDTLLKCTRCKTWVNPGVEHEIDWENPDGGVDPATCTEPGHMYDKCAYCDAKELKILPAKGHREVTVTVPSTCGTFAYTFTYCTRPDCDVNKMTSGVTYDGNKAVSVVDELGIVYNVMVPALDEVRDMGDILELDGFLLGLDQVNLGKNLYFNGKMDRSWLATTADPAEAVSVYIEKLEYYRNRYLLYFFNEDGEKTYISFDEYKANKAAIELTDEVPEVYYEWNDEYDILVAVGETSYYFLGAYQTFNTIGFSSISYLEDKTPAEIAATQFMAVPYSVGEEDGVYLISYEFDVEGGYNAEKHVYNPEIGSLKMPTCDEAGSVDMVCAYCLDTFTAELPAGCMSIADLTDGANLTTTIPAEIWAASKIKEPQSADPTCTKAGYVYKMCTECEELYKITTEAPLGHDMVDDHDDTGKLDHINRTGYIGIDCVDIEECGYAIKLKTLKWEYSDTLFDYIEDALEAHEAHIHTDACGEECETPTLIHVNRAKAGNCDEAGIEIYMCTGCRKNVRVKQQVRLENKKGEPILDEDGNEQWFLTGEHAGHRMTTVVEIDGVEVELINHKDPTCTEAGWHITYECLLCGDVVGNKQVGVKEDLKKVDHTYVDISALVEYEAAPCDTPDYFNYKYMCVVCRDLKNDGTELLYKQTLTTGEADGCAAFTYEVYKCHCGEIHVRSVGSYDHKLVALEQTKDNKGTVWAPATCYQVGWYTMQCEFCKGLVKLPTATIEHENAAGEKFTDSCLDEVTDRHCVVCCEAFEHDRKGNEHDCYETDDDDEYICVADYHTHTYCTFCHVCDEECKLICSELENEEHECHVCTEDCEDECEDACIMICPLDVCEDECKVHCNGCDKHCNGFKGGCYAVIDDGCIILTSHHYELAENRGSTCVQDAHALYICADCKGEKMAAPMIPDTDPEAEEGDMINLNDYIVSAGTPYDSEYYYFYGHKPVANPLTLANYVYENLKYQEVIVNEDGEFELVVADIDNAQFVEFKAPTFTEAGFAKFYCAHCKAVVEQVLPKLGGMGFELDVKNANGQDGYTYGSLVEVIVSINGNDADINNFEFMVFSQFQYVGFETLNEELFNLTVTEPEAGITGAVISGVAANTAAGKMQNININEKTELVKLYFRIDAEEYLYADLFEELESNENGFVFLNGEVNQWISGTKTEAVYPNAYLLFAEIEVDLFGDFDNNGRFGTNDLSLALTLLTGEHEEGATYDVRVDMNKDGVITLEDLSIAHNYNVGNLDVEEVFFMGMSEAEIEIFEELHEGGYCYSCGAELAEEAEFCSKCGLKQPTENEGI